MRPHLLALGLLVALTAAAAEKEPPPKFDPTLPPCVVKTVPADRAKDVDANLREIKVTFDRPMITKQQWSWIIHEHLGIYPGAKDGPPPRWEDGGRTCCLPVKLIPNTLYAVGVNSFRHTGFRDPNNRVAVPYTLIFRTGKAKKPPEF